MDFAVLSPTYVLGADFRRFDERMKKLADHIRMANKDAEEVETSSRKISMQFARIEAAEIEQIEKIEEKEPEDP